MIEHRLASCVQWQDLWNDFAALHQNEVTDLEKPEHRNYFGETLFGVFLGLKSAQESLALRRRGHCLAHPDTFPRRRTSWLPRSGVALH